MKITNDLLRDYLLCKYKTYLKLQGKHEAKTDYERLQFELENIYKNDAIKRIFPSYSNKFLQDASLTFSDLGKGRSFIFEASISTPEIISSCDVLERIAVKSALGSFQYIPIHFTRSSKITNADKFILAFKGYIIGQIQGGQPEYGKIVFGEKYQTQKVILNPYLSQIPTTIEEFTSYNGQKSEPVFTLKDYCRNCEFCRSHALEKDDLSLLRGMSLKEIEKQNKKGIFTVTQLSYTFRPRKRRDRAKNYSRIHFFELKALAIRENKIFVYRKFELPVSQTHIYLDIEGLDDNNFHYLIGLVIFRNNHGKRYSFWADNKDEEKLILEQFLKVCEQYIDYTIFHYGSYEISFLKRMKKKFFRKYHKAIDQILNRCVNSDLTQIRGRSARARSPGMQFSFILRGRIEE